MTWICIFKGRIRTLESTKCPRSLDSFHKVIVNFFFIDLTNSFTYFLLSYSWIIAIEIFVKNHVDQFRCILETLCFLDLELDFSFLKKHVDWTPNLISKYAAEPDLSYISWIEYFIIKMMFGGKSIPRLPLILNIFYLI